MDDIINNDDNDKDRSSAQQHAASAVASSTTTVIPIHCDYNNNNEDTDDEGDEDDDLPRWTLIEVNGELLPPKEMPLSSPTLTTTTTTASLECELGCIWFDQDDAGKIVPVLIIGSHELRGSIEPLVQPFCILEKQVVEEENDDDVLDAKSNVSSSSSSSCYHVRGIIDRKLLFRQYPKTLIR